MKKENLRFYILGAIVLGIVIAGMEAKSDEKAKPDTTISVSVEKITSQIAAKQEYLKQVQAEISKLDSYRKELEMEATGTFYQINALTKLKQEADTLTTKKGRK